MSLAVPWEGTGEPAQEQYLEQPWAAVPDDQKVAGAVKRSRLLTVTLTGLNWGEQWREEGREKGAKWRRYPKDPLRVGGPQGW
jgi:hypothetical protein